MFKRAILTIVLSFSLRTMGVIIEVTHFLPRIGSLAGRTIGLTQYGNSCDVTDIRSENT